MKQIYILLVILILAIFLRVWQLNKIPIELFGDEIDVGIQAYSVLKTGKDYSGNFLPVMFRSFTEYRLPMLIYSTIPTIAALGLNEWGVRLPSVLFGVLSVLGIFLISKTFFGVRTALIAAFLLAISPWHLHFSRQANDAGTILTLILFAVWLFVEGLESYPKLIISTILFALTFYSYSIATLFTPLLFISLVIIYKKEVMKVGFKKLFLLLIIGLIVLIPYINLFLHGTTSKRFSTISIASNNDIIDEISNRRKNEGDIASIFFHNKPLAFFYALSGNYIRSLSADFLFLKGDPNLRNSVGSGGELYLFQILLILIGFLLILTYRNKFSYLILSWLLLSPLPSTLTNEGGYHAGRLILLLPPLLMLSALGLDFIIKKRNILKSKFVILILSILMIIELPVYFHRYYSEWSKDSWRFWQSGYKEALTYIKMNDSKYSRIFFNNTYEPALPRFLFYYQYDPKAFQEERISQKNQENVVVGFNGFKLGDKYYFGIVSKLIEDEGFSDLMQKNDLYLVNVRDEVGAADWISTPPKRLNIIKTIYNPFKKPIFFIVTKRV